MYERGGYLTGPQTAVKFDINVNLARSGFEGPAPSPRGLRGLRGAAIEAPSPASLMPPRRTVTPRGGKGRRGSPAGAGLRGARVKRRPSGVANAVVCCSSASRLSFIHSASRMTGAVSLKARFGGPMGSGQKVLAVVVLVIMGVRFRSPECGAHDRTCYVCPLISL